MFILIKKGRVVVSLTESLERISRNIIGLNNETLSIKSNIQKIRKVFTRIKLVNKINGKII